ncbi:MAG: AAA family ATPase, partial [Pseudomonadales bacterium]
MKLLDRTIEAVLRDSARQYPVVTVTGPRQSGKTTLCRKVFPDLDYVSLENMDTRQYALEDPRGLLAGLP